MNDILKQLKADKIQVVLEPEVTRVYSTGSLLVDWLLGAGGLPVGRFVNVAGWEAWGKTTLALMMCKAAVERGGYAAYLDMEAALDPLWAAKFGLKVGNGEDRRFWLIQPDTAEQALNAILKMVCYPHPAEKGRSAFDLIVLDSLAALVTQAELDGEIGDQVVAGSARALSQFYRMAKTDLAKSTTTVVTLNQLRDDFGRSFGYGPKTRQPGGKSVRFYSSVMAEMRQKPVPLVNKATGEVEGLEFKLKVTKNKVGRPGREGTFVIYLDTGVADLIAELAKLGREFGLFTKEDGSPIRGACSWYLDGLKLGTGEAQVTQFLDDHRDVAFQVEQRVRALIRQMNTGEQPLHAETLDDDLLDYGESEDADEA